MYTIAATVATAATIIGFLIQSNRRKKQEILYLKQEKKTNEKFIEKLKNLNNDLAISKDEIRNQLYEAQAKFNICEQSAEILNDKLKKCRDISLNRLKKAQRLEKELQKCK